MNVNCLLAGLNYVFGITRGLIRCILHMDIESFPAFTTNYPYVSSPDESVRNANVINDLFKLKAKRYICNKRLDFFH